MAAGGPLRPGYGDDGFHPCGVEAIRDPPGRGRRAGVVTYVAGLVWRQQRLGGLELLDSRGWYTHGEAVALFDGLDRLDANARLVYAATGLTIDMAFPAAYGLLLAILLFRLFRSGVALFLLAMAAADMLENMTVAGLALSHAGAPTPMAWLAAVFTLVKTVLMPRRRRRWASVRSAACGFACGGDPGATDRHVHNNR